MIRIFYGDDRVKAKQEIIKILGNDYEVIEGSEIPTDNLPSIFFGASLFAAKRNILIRDFTVNKPAYDSLINYIGTPHNVIILETKLDKRTANYKALKDKIEFHEFKLAENQDFRLVFDIYRVAKTDGERAVQMLNQVKQNEDPIKFTGLLISQAMRDFSARPDRKGRQILKSLAKIDMQMKTTKVEPWLLVESFLLRLPTSC